MNLRELRKKQNLTQKELADRLSVSLSMVSRYELGQIEPSEERLKELAAALNVKPDEIDLPTPIVQLIINDKENQTNRIMTYTCLLRSKGYCELCGNEAPFMYNGKPFLKIHRLNDDESLSSNIDNYAALCPNCYEKVTLLNNPDDINTIKENIKENMKE